MRSEYFTRGELRAVLKLLRILASHESCHRAKIQTLLEMMAVAAILSKGKSSTPALSFLLCRRYVLCWFAEILIAAPWVESCKQPADKSSRDTDGDGTAGCRPTSSQEGGVSPARSCGHGEVHLVTVRRCWCAGIQTAPAMISVGVELLREMFLMSLLFIVYDSERDPERHYRGTSVMGCGSPVGPLVRTTPFIMLRRS